MIWIIILGLIAGYREVQILCDRGSWRYLDFREVFWFTNQADKKESWKDSFHISNGLYALVLCIFCTTCTNDVLYWLCDICSLITNIIAYWLIYMWFRNLMMHVILPYKRRWGYIIPFLKK